MAPHSFNVINKSSNRSLLGSLGVSSSIFICYKKSWIPAPQIKYTPSNNLIKNKKSNTLTIYKPFKFRCIIQISSNRTPGSAIPKRGVILRSSNGRRDRKLADRFENQCAQHIPKRFGAVVQHIRAQRELERRRDHGESVRRVYHLLRAIRARYVE